MIKYKTNLLPLFLLGFQQLGAEALVLGTATPASISPTSALASSTPTITFLSLPITTAAPDPLGISEVSGFYGPGAWAGWFLTLAAAWCRLGRGSKAKIDTNTWLFLIGTNWAALDLVRSIAKTRSFEGNETTSKEMGRIGASFTVLWWGTAHALAQLIISNVLNDTAGAPPALLRRIVTLLIGLVFPSIALCVALFTMLQYEIPALYWKGMEMDEHSVELRTACAVGLWCLACALFGGFTAVYRTLPERLRVNIELVWNSMRPGYIIVAVTACHIVWFILLMITKSMIAFLILVPCLPVYVVAFLGIFPAFALFSLGFSCMNYVANAYAPWTKASPSQSCFFMPCSPQPLSDSDQAYALLAGLVLFFGAEIAPGVLKKFREKRKSKRLFEQEVQRRIGVEMARRTNSGLAQQDPTPSAVPVGVVRND